MGGRGRHCTTILAYACPVSVRRLLATWGAALLVAGTTLTAPGAFAADAAPRVVNGREPVPGEMTGLVFIRAGGSLCSGTLVDPTHVITAAHCAHTRPPNSITVGTTTTGALPITAWSPVSAVDVHPEYDSTTFENDIAVLTLPIRLQGAEPMALTNTVEARAALRAGRTVHSAGFGTTSAKGSSSGRALVADMTVIPNRVCADDVSTYVIGGVTFVGLAVDTSTAVCAIGVVPGTDLIIDTCQGDSGGPLYAPTPNGVRLLGLVSVGVGCAGFDGDTELEIKTPGIYTRIAPYLTWLAGVGVRAAPAPPAIAATPAGPDGIAVVFGPADPTTSTAYRAVAIGDGGTGECTTDVRESACTVTGLQPGTVYSIIGYAVLDSVSSVASNAVVSVAGVPSARPPKPRIDGTRLTPAGRLSIDVDGVDPAAWTSTEVICKSSERTLRGAVVEGRAVLAVKRGESYRCYAKSTNAVGGMRSAPIRIAV